MSDEEIIAVLEQVAAEMERRNDILEDMARTQYDRLSLEQREYKGHLETNTERLAHNGEFRRRVL